MGRLTFLRVNIRMKKTGYAPYAFGGESALGKSQVKDMAKSLGQTLSSFFKGKAVRGVSASDIRKP